MSVTTTTYTTNSKKITIGSYETGSTNIISAVDTAITGLGWTSYDTVNTTLFNPIITKVYRVLNYDGITYKYFIMRWDTIKLQFVTSTCESWNTSTHLPTNESWGNAGTFVQGYDLYNSYIIVSATARHIMIWNFINNQPGLWTAVFEFERIAAEDLATVSTTPYPCWAWTNSLMLGTPFNLSTANNSNWMLAFPRTPNGNVGVAAATTMATVTNRGMMPPTYPQDSSLNTTGTDTNYLHLGSYYKNYNYGWDTTKTPVSPVSVDGMNNSMPFGRAFNVGITKSLGAAGDTVLANLEVTGGWPSSVGTLTESFLLPLNGGTELTQTGYTAAQTISFYGNTNVAAGKSIAIGDNIWFAAADGIRTTSISTGQAGNSVRRLADSNGIHDIVFDGQRTIYGSAANGIVKIDTITYANSYATSTQTLANGCSYLGIDMKNVYAGARSGNAHPTVVTLDQATFTISTGNTYVLANAALATTIMATPMPDYTGNVWISTVTYSSASSANVYVTSFSANTGSANYVPTYINGAGTNYYPGGAYYYDAFQTNRLWHIWAGYVSNNTTDSETLLISEFSTTAPMNAGVVTKYSQTSTAGASSGTVTNIGARLNGAGGDLFVTPFRGQLLVGGKLETVVSSTGFAAVKGNRLYSLWTLGNAAPSAIRTINTGSIATVTLSAAAGIYTNTVSMFAPLRFTANTDERMYVINGIYGQTQLDGTITGRLILKG